LESTFDDRDTTNGGLLLAPARSNLDLDPTGETSVSADRKGTIESEIETRAELLVQFLYTCWNLIRVAISNAPPGIPKLPAIMPLQAQAGTPISDVLSVIAAKPNRPRQHALIARITDKLQMPAHKCQGTSSSDWLHACP